MEHTIYTRLDWIQCHVEFYFKIYLINVPGIWYGMGYFCEGIIICVYINSSISFIYIYIYIYVKVIFLLKNIYVCEFHLVEQWKISVLDKHLESVSLSLRASKSIYEKAICDWYALFIYLHVTKMVKLVKQSTVICWLNCRIKHIENVWLAFLCKNKVLASIHTYESQNFYSS